MLELVSRIFKYLYLSNTEKVNKGGTCCVYIQYKWPMCCVTVKAFTKSFVCFLGFCMNWIINIGINICVLFTAIEQMVWILSKVFWHPVRQQQGCILIRHYWNGRKWLICLNSTHKRLKIDQMFLSKEIWMSHICNFKVICLTLWWW